MVAVPLAVEVGAKLPQAEVLQVTVHLTPALAVSFATTAVSGVVVPSINDAGAAGLSVTVIAGAVIAMLADILFVLSVTEVAVTVTLDTGVPGAV